MQPNQELLSGQLRARHPDQQLAPSEPSVRTLILPIAASNSLIMSSRSTKDL
jgi:hypothetical protein